jgi:hypothetical protein
MGQIFAVTGELTQVRIAFRLCLSAQLPVEFTEPTRTFRAVESSGGGIQGAQALKHRLAVFVLCYLMLFRNNIGAEVIMREANLSGAI